jgi:hypothetical protein
MEDNSAGSQHNVQSLGSGTWSLEPLPWWQGLAEWCLIALVVWIATQSLHNFSSQMQLGGNDLVHLTRAADFAGQFLRSSGKIPLWDPFIGNGEPMLEAAQSFILNPFMSLPIMLLGAKPGVLAVVLLHAALFGWGGWVWGRVMGFGAGGRLLMGALLVSSGSMTGPLNHGVFQLALSQAYMPYVFAGLTAMLFVRNQRWGIVLFVTAAALLVFSGSFWYVLPTAFGCALIALFALIEVKRRKPRLNIARLQLLLLAGIFVVGAAGIRLVTINREQLFHPTDSYDFQLSYLQVFVNYFDPHYTIDKGQWFVIYHYVVPVPLLMLVVGLALVTWRFTKHGLVGGWRIILAGTLFVLIISFFGMGPTPAVKSIYEALPFLQDWRNPGRMAAAASPWIVLAVSWGFDRLARAALQLFRQKLPGKLIGAGLLTALAVVGFAGVMEIARNWPESLHLASTVDAFPAHQVGAQTLRELYPSPFVAIHTGWITDFVLNENLIRHTYGDNQVFAIGVPPTIGTEQWDYVEEFAFGDTPDSGNGRWLRDNGYSEMSNVPVMEGIGAVLDYNPDALPYAYVVAEQTLINQGSTRLIHAQTQPVTYYHRIDEIEVQVENVAPDHILVLQETAYPGWVVTVNGTPQTIESVHRRVAVRLPADVENATVVFRYQPAPLYAGALISVFSMVALSAYALRADRRFLPSRILAFFDRIPEFIEIVRLDDNKIKSPVQVESANMPVDKQQTLRKYAVILGATGTLAVVFLQLPAESRAPLFLLFVLMSVGYELYSAWKEASSRPETNRFVSTVKARLGASAPGRNTVSTPPSLTSAMDVDQKDAVQTGAVVAPPVVTTAAKRAIDSSIESYVVYGKPDAKLVRLTLPPSTESYKIEFIYPPTTARIINAAMFAITVAALLYLVITQQSRKR